MVHEQGVLFLQHLVVECSGAVDLGGRLWLKVPLWSAVCLSGTDQHHAIV